MSEALHTKFDERFTEKINTPEGISDFKEMYKQLVDVYKVSPDFLKIMKDNNVFAGHDIIDILHPKTSMILKQEGDIYDGNPEIRAAIRESSNNSNYERKYRAS